MQTRTRLWDYNLNISDSVISNAMLFGLVHLGKYDIPTVSHHLKLTETDWRIRIIQFTMLLCVVYIYPKLQQKLHLSTFVIVLLLLLQSNTEFNKLYNDTQFLKIEVILLDTTFTSFVYSAHYYVH